MVNTSRRNETARTRSLTQRQAHAVCCCAATVTFATAEFHAAPKDAYVEVTVQGDRNETTPGGRDPSIASSVVAGHRLSAPGLQAQDVLRTQPGVVVTESGGFGAPSAACIRGANAADTPVYLAGVRLNDDVGGTADLSMIPLWLIHRIEIYRGNAPLEADRLGPGGRPSSTQSAPRKPPAVSATTLALGEPAAVGRTEARGKVRSATSLGYQTQHRRPAH
jgi:outer membrane receptor protein involved in Fe transport